MDNRISRNIPIIGLAKTAVTKGSSEEVPLVAIGAAAEGPVVEKGANDQEKVIQQLEKAIRAVQGPEKAYEISVHQQTHTIMVKVFDKQTGDLIREIPQEKLLDVAANLMELNGLIFDEKA
ncbi:flagellar protein FlaG [compost metagenome]